MAEPQPRTLTPYKTLHDGELGERFTDFAPTITRLDGVGDDGVRLADVEPDPAELAEIEANPIEDEPVEDLFTAIKEADERSLSLVPPVEETGGKRKAGKAAPA